MNFLAGTIVNAVALLLGGLLGGFSGRVLPLRAQLFLQVGLSVAVVWMGFRLLWQSVHGFSGGWSPHWRTLVAAIAAITLGRLLSRGVKLQALFNRIGRHAREQLERPEPAAGMSEGFTVMTALACGTPLAVAGAVADGLGQPGPLCVKAAMDGLTACSLGMRYGPAPALAVVPLLALQGALATGAAALLPWLAPRGLVEPVMAATGFLLLTVGLVLFKVRKVALADYLPGIFLAPLLLALWRL